MPNTSDTSGDSILAKAQSRDIEAGLGMWSLLNGNALPDSSGLSDMLEDVVQDYFLNARIVKDGFEIFHVGTRLRQLTPIFAPSQHASDLPESLAETLSALFANAHAIRHPVYATCFSRYSRLVHRWEMLVMPVLEGGAPAVIAMVLPLEFHQDVLQAMVEANPVGICAAEVIRDAEGAVSDFDIYLANDAACEAIGKDRETLLHSSLSQSLPTLLEGTGAKRVLELAESRKNEFFQYSRSAGEAVRTFGVSASCRGNSLVLTFTEITDLMETRAQLTAQHEAALAANAELLRQKEDLHATAESLEIARRALSAEVQRRAALESRLRHLAETDSLTGLANRRHFFDLAQAELRRTKRYGGSFSLAMLDIDHFKAINDSLGHAAGDKVIGAVASACRLLTRAELDLVGRIGGEEFAILLPETRLAGAAELAERIRKEIADLRISYEGTTISLTASIGIAEFHAEDADITDVLRRADKSLYTAKNAGRNQVGPIAA